MRTRIERVSGRGVDRAIARWKRWQRQGWTVIVLRERATKDLIAVAIDEGEPAPDRGGQYELDVGG